MRVKYIGETFGALSLTSNAIYECLGVEYGMLRIVDDSEDDYLYSAANPRPADGSTKGGIWEVVEDDENKTLQRAIDDMVVAKRSVSS